MYMLPMYCEPTRIQRELDNSRFITDYCHGEDSYQQMNIGGHTVTVNSHSTKLYDVIAEVEKIANGKVKAGKIHNFSCRLSDNAFVGTIRVGSHNEIKKWTDEAGNKHKFNNVVCDYRTYFHDCLISKDWLEAHYKDVFPEPTMELSVNGKELHLNGNFKSGMIHDFCVNNAEIWERPHIKGKKIKGAK